MAVAPWRNSHEILAHMAQRDLRRDAVCCTAAMLQTWQRSFDIFDTMHLSRLTNLASLNSLIDAAGKAEHWPLALRCLQSDVDLISFNAALTACERASQWHKALKIYGDMKVRDEISLFALECASREPSRL